jgi:hypothetical protein
MTTQLEWTAYNTPDMAVAGSSMNTLTTASYALGADIDNSTGAWTDADLLLVLSSAVTAGAGNPNVAVWLLPAVDGTNYPSPPGGSAAAAPANLCVGSILVVPSVSTSVLVLRGITLPPSHFKILIQNNLGVSLPATNTSACSLYRYRLQSV